MTNTIYFHNTNRDVFSSTTEETSSTTDNQPGSSSVNPNDDEGGIFEYSNLKEFSFYELETATRNFQYDHIGGGFYGRVFKCWIDENKLTASNPLKGIPVAIKQLKGLFQHSYFHANSEFGVVRHYLGKLYHPNLVRLIGYCLQEKESLLVYEFMPQRSLADHLFENVSTPLSWRVRMKIALGAAKGLAFLHSAPINVIHRNFKSSIILLDMDYNAKLSGFKLAMNGPTGDRSHVSTELAMNRPTGDRSHVSTEVMGTSGYLAPEYIATGHLTAQCDVYMFGVVLLEMLCGRPVIDMNRPIEEHDLVDWAKPYLNDEHEVYRVADRRLKGNYSLESFQKAANLAFMCLSLNGMSRPKMDEVVKLLGNLELYL